MHMTIDAFLSVDSTCMYIPGDVFLSVDSTFTYIPGDVDLPVPIGQTHADCVGHGAALNCQQGL